MIHYGVEYICSRLGYNAFHCRKHRCEGTCCVKIVTAASIRTKFAKTCTACDDQNIKRPQDWHPKKDRPAKWFCSNEEACFCSAHMHTGKCCILLSGYIDSLVKRLDSERRSHGEKPAKEAKNRYGSDCPSMVRANGKNKKVREAKCGSFAGYFCKKRNSFHCFDHIHGLHEKSCCKWWQGEQTALGNTDVYKVAEEMFEETRNPCGRCKEEGSFWCKKKNEWRCHIHMHVKWECCDYSESTDTSSSPGAPGIPRRGWFAEEADMSDDGPPRRNKKLKEVEFVNS